MITIKFRTDAIKEARKVLAKMKKKLLKLASPNTGTFNYESAQFYRTLLRENLMSEKFAMSYRKPLTQRYATWKAKKGKPSGYWKLDMDLYNEISAWRGEKNAWFAGIAAGPMDKGGKGYGVNTRKAPTEIAVYAFANEMRRPLFGPTNEQMVKEKWGVLGKRALDDVAYGWGRRL